MVSPSNPLGPRDFLIPHVAFLFYRRALNTAQIAKILDKTEAEIYARLSAAHKWAGEHGYR